MNAQQALYQFWSGFGLNAYDENTVPDSAQLPYITYEAASDFFGSRSALSASLWYKSTAWDAITEKEQQIADFIGRGGRMIACDNGGMWIKRGSPWAQRMKETSDSTIRRIVLNYEVEYVL